MRCGCLPFTCPAFPGHRVALPLRVCVTSQAWWLTSVIQHWGVGSRKTGRSCLAWATQWHPFKKTKYKGCDFAVPTLMNRCLLSVCEDVIVHCWGWGVCHWVEHLLCKPEDLGFRNHLNEPALAVCAVIPAGRASLGLTSQPCQTTRGVFRIKKDSVSKTERGWGDGLMCKCKDLSAECLSPCEARHSGVYL